MPDGAQPYESGLFPTFLLGLSHTSLSLPNPIGVFYCKPPRNFFETINPTYTEIKTCLFVLCLTGYKIVN